MHANVGPHKNGRVHQFHLNQRIHFDLLTLWPFDLSACHVAAKKWIHLLIYMLYVQQSLYVILTKWSSALRDFIGEVNKNAIKMT